jgi:hypothetical protein
MAISWPLTIEQWRCPACGKRVVGTYDVDEGRLVCTKTRHRELAVKRLYWVEDASLLRETLAEVERLRGYEEDAARHWRDLCDLSEAALDVVERYEAGELVVPTNDMSLDRLRIALTGPAVGAEASGSPSAALPGENLDAARKSTTQTSPADRSIPDD